jgi:hypothetical protein
MSLKVNKLMIAAHGLILILFVSCTDIDIKKDKQILLNFQKQEQQAHLKKDVHLLDDLFADTICQIQNGLVTYLTRKQLVERFTKYFNSVEFIAWEDSASPVFELSRDGTQAHIIVQKHVEVRINGDSTRAIEITDFAWTELWKKQDQEWHLFTITSTRKTRDED